MVELFEIDKENRLTFSPQALAIKEFKELWDRDSSKDKKVAVEELGYVYYMTDFRSPMRTYNKIEKEAEVRDSVISDKDWEPDAAVKVAMDKYRELQSTPSMEFLESAEDAATKTKEYFKNIDYEERDERGRPVFKVKEVTGALKDCVGIIDTIKKLEDQVKKEVESSGRLEGGKEKSLFEDA